jgi:hypothetical protein|tara:strand:- start:49 stop:261 length:213 start_codon:yes stop_codon:yes gene_type:complete
MPADVTESKEPSVLLQEFKDRYSNIQKETQQLQGKIRENESTALKLLGAIETLEYLNPPVAEEPVTEPTE